MTAPTHAMPRRVLAAIAAGGGGAEAIRHLREAERSRTRLLVHHLVERAAVVRHPHAAATRRALDLLAEVEDTHADAVAALLSYPPVAAWAVHTVRTLYGPRPAEANPGFLAAVTAVALVRAGVDAVLDLPAHPDGNRHVALPTLGWFDVAAGTTLRVRTDGEAARAVPMPGGGPPLWSAARHISAVHGTRRLTAYLDVAVWHHALGTRFCAERGVLDTDADAALWQDRLAAAWELLAEHHEEAAQEIAEALGVLAPLAAPSHGTASSSLAGAFGAVAMSVPQGSRDMALALAHEIQHSKFAALARLYPLISGEPPDRYYAPWRPDPRPLTALLDGAYAFVAVARFWRTQRLVDTDPPARQHAETNFWRWTHAAHDVARTVLPHPALTAMGAFLSQRMLDVLSGWLREPVSHEAVASARALAEAHLAQWRRAHAATDGPW